MTDFITKHLPDAYDTLAPDGSEIRLLPELPAGGMVHCTLLPGGVTQAIRHKTVEEIWYVVSGQGQIWRKNASSEAITDLTPGTSLTIPLGVHFQFRNTGDAPLVIIITTLPAWPGMDEAVPVDNFWERPAS